MIAITLEGRLGNQLFQYAFIYAASRKLDTSFYLDKSIENFMLPKYFDIKNDFLEPLDNHVFSVKGYKNIFSIHAKKAFYHIIGLLIFRERKVIIENEAPVEDVLKQLKNNYLYKGYFHSESYFEAFKDEVRCLYKIKKPHVDAFEKIQRQIGVSKKKVVIHIRRTDYVGLNMSLPITYYKKAIETIDSTDVQYIFISDDPSFIEVEFSYISNKYISVNNEIIDLQFLINADICILSNSSFSWWGAWLNKNQNKHVYAPKYWIGFNEEKEFPAGISDHMKFNWIQV